MSEACILDTTVCFACQEFLDLEINDGISGLMSYHLTFQLSSVFCYVFVLSWAMVTLRQVSVQFRSLLCIWASIGLQQVSTVQATVLRREICSGI